jgi:hypothetical protein
LLRLRPAASTIGNVNQNVDPWPGSLLTPIVPPIMVTSRLEIANPNPVPPNRRSSKYPLG